MYGYHSVTPRWDSWQSWQHLTLQKPVDVVAGFVLPFSSFCCCCCSHSVVDVLLCCFLLGQVICTHLPPSLSPNQSVLSNYLKTSRAQYSFGQLVFIFLLLLLPFFPPALFILFELPVLLSFSTTLATFCGNFFFFGSDSARRISITSWCGTVVEHVCRGTNANSSNSKA